MQMICKKKEVEDFYRYMSNILNVYFLELLRDLRERRLLPPFWDLRERLERLFPPFWDLRLEARREDLRERLLPPVMDLRERRERREVLADARRERLLPPD
jgi:hypothetical protein